MRASRPNAAAARRSRSRPLRAGSVLRGRSERLAGVLLGEPLVELMPLVGGERAAGSPAHVAAGWALARLGVPGVLCRKPGSATLKAFHFDSSHHPGILVATGESRHPQRRDRGIPDSGEGGEPLPLRRGGTSRAGCSRSARAAMRLLTLDPKERGATSLPG